MKPASNYKIAWNVPKNEGMLLLEIPNGIEQIQVNSANEARVLLQQLRQEQQATISKGVVMTGFRTTIDEASSEATTLPIKDNLQLLSNVNAAVEAALHAKGIYTFKALAEMDPNLVNKIYLKHWGK